MFASCNSGELEFDNIQVQPIQGTYSFPLGEVTYTMRQLIENQNDSELDFQVDDDSLITLAYFDTFDYQSNNDFVQIDDITNEVVVDLGASTPAVGPATVDITEQFTLDYNAIGEEVIDSVFYESGDVSVTVNTDIQGTLDYTLTFNNTVTVVNEQPLELSNATPTRSLVNYKTILDRENNNEFITDLSATINLAGGQAFTGTESLSFDITFANQTFSVVYGKFGQDTIAIGNQTLDIEFFSEMGEEGIIFGNPILRFNFNSTIGIPLGIDFSQLFGDDGNGGTQTFLSGEITETIPVIEMGNIDNPGEAVASSIEVTSGNSSIVDLLATSPARLGFNVNAISNPYDVNAINFISQTNEIDATIEVEIPMEVRLEDLQQSGTLSLGQDGLDVSNLDSAFLRVSTVNGLPFSATLALEIQDADSNTLYTVGDRLVLNAPFINIDGFVTDPNGISADIPLGPEGVQAIETGSHIVLTVTLNTPGSLNSRDIFVKILTDYSLLVSVGIGGKVNIEL